MDTTKDQWQGSIELYSGGVALNGVRGMRGKAGPGGKRGKIAGWSSASRRRMREFMLTHRASVPCIEVGVTFTIPGPVLPASKVSELWRDWCRKAQKQGWGVVWRVELQGRGQRHWHCLASVPIAALEWLDALGGARGFERPTAVDMSVPLSTADGAGYRRWQELAACCCVRQSWSEAITRLGSFSFNPSLHVGSIEIGHIDDLMEWPSARERACDVQVDEGRGAWLRYLQDHATKRKQSQLAVNVGRHWGVIGRGLYARVIPEAVFAFDDDRHWWRFLRAYQRLCTPVLRDKRPEGKVCVFGKRLGGRVRRGAWGRSIWYSRPETVERLARWAASS